MEQKASFLCQEYTKHTCTLAKSTRLRSLSIWLIWEVFCRTARAACARWFRDVYLRRVWAKALTADTCAREEDLSEIGTCLDRATADIYTLTLVWIILWGMLLMALVSQLSRLLAKLRMAWVKAPVETDRWAPKRGRQDHANVSEQEDFKRLLFCSASLLLFDRKRLKYLYYLK